MHQFSKNWRLLAVAFVLRQGFPSALVMAGKGFSQVAGWLTVQWSFVVKSWALADEWSELLVEV